jgi:hypothetical protein
LRPPQEEAREGKAVKAETAGKVAVTAAAKVVAKKAGRAGKAAVKAVKSAAKEVAKAVGVVVLERSEAATGAGTRQRTGR